MAWDIIAALILITQLVLPDGTVVSVTLRYDVDQSTCIDAVKQDWKEVAKGYEHTWCTDKEPSNDVLFAHLTRT